VIKLITEKETLTQRLVVSH